MYTRSYTDDKGGILIPESYGGTALTQRVQEEESARKEEVGKNPWEEEADTVSATPKETKNTDNFSEKKKLRTPAFLSNILKNSNFSLQNIGTEEILLLATAAFLFFINDGDRECAIMLLLLLFL